MLTLLILSLGMLNSSHAEQMEPGCTISDSGSFYRVESKDNSGKLQQVDWKKLPELQSASASEAARVCESRGLQLPTRKNFEALRNCFQSNGRGEPNLSAKGLGDFTGPKGKFPELENKWFWLADAPADAPGMQLFVYTKNAFVYYGDPTYPYSILCVKQRNAE